jgi:mannosyltransferase
MMPILFDNIVFELQQAGGISTYWAELIKRFSEADPSHIFLEGSRAKNNKARLEVSLPSSSVKNSFFASRASRYFPAPVFCDQSHFFFSSYYRVPACRKSKVIITVYDFIYEKFVTGWRKDIHSFQKKMAIERADSIICISDNTKNDLLSFFPRVDPNSVHVIYIGVSDCFSPIVDKDVKISLLKDMGVQPNYVLYVGSRVSYKNFSVAVKALREIPEVHFVCVGGGAFSADEVAFLTENLPNRFKHISPSIPELNVLYNNALCLLYPSSYEGFGIPLVEAMKAGCPVVAVGTSSIPEVVGNAGLIIGKPSKEEIIEAIMFLENSLIRQDQVYRGLANSQRFSWQSCYEEHLKVFQLLEK